MSRICLAIALLLACPSAALADAETRERGRQRYERYCAACHGLLADGHGPVAPSLRTPPADLTRLSERYGSPLPKDALAEFIDGRRLIAGHGSREMPVWGERLYEEHRPGPDIELGKRITILLILEYLESIQGPATPTRTR